MSETKRKSGVRAALVLALSVAATASPGCSARSGSQAVPRATLGSSSGPRSEPGKSAGQTSPPDPIRSTSGSAADGGTTCAVSSTADARAASDTPADTLRARTEHYQRALRALELGRPSSTVRVLWLGDSHAAADYWPNAVRLRLQQRFGVGGPGFLNLGLEHYRHADTVVRRHGPWLVEPGPPSTRTQQGDGVYGLAGIRTVPLAPDSRASVSLGPRAVRGRARWKLFVRLDDEQSGLTVRLGAAEQTVRHQPGSAEAADPTVIDLEGDPTEPFAVQAAAGRPRLFGVIVESSAGGVVIDTLGINGARVATALAWAQGPWEQAVSSRAPDLVIVQYGTNEVFDALAPQRYEAQYEELLARIARAAPHAACLLIGPTAVGRGGSEAQKRASRIEAVQRAAADHLGCSFFSAALAMGGHDSFARWSRLSPPLATRDGVHLTPAGYRALGEALADVLLEQYERFLAGG